MQVTPITWESGRKGTVAAIHTLVACAQGA